ncbi:MAG: radical SAM protein [Clostridia bacterium]|nr:radical SAM protein [Clostridia bacterium]
MKKHAIIPIFIPHKGCPHACVFCNQNAITARTANVTPEDVRRIADEWLSTLEGRGLEEIELSFFGGSFTGIPLEQQSAFLAVAKEYKEAGKIDKIHLSTRPDYIDEEILDNLKAYGADVIELGVQSFDPEVLRLSERGHGPEDVYRACDLIKSYGCFTLGIQLMIGLPGDSYDKCMESVRRTIEIGPEIARLYPTVIISGTKLCKMYEEGSYEPFLQEEMLRTTTDMYRKLTDAGINVIRVGLKASALINDSEDSRVVGDTYHPAFRQLVEGRIIRDKAEELLAQHLKDLPDENQLLITAGPGTFSSLIGHKAENKQYFADKYSRLRLIYREDPAMNDGTICISKYND